MQPVKAKRVKNDHNVPPTKPVVSAAGGETGKTGAAVIPAEVAAPPTRIREPRVKCDPRISVQDQRWVMFRVWTLTNHVRLFSNLTTDRVRSAFQNKSQASL